MAKIIDVVKAKRDANVAAGDLGDHSQSRRTGELARAAIIGGIPSVAWKAYMEHLGPLDPDQLKRLLATDGTLGDPGLDYRRAYLVANGACGMPSPDTQNLPVLVVTIDDDPPVPIPVEA